MPAKSSAKKPSAKSLPTKPRTPLQVFLCEPGTTKPKRGAISRAAEYLDIAYNSMLRFLANDWTPSPLMAGRIKAMIADKIDLSPNYFGPRKARLAKGRWAAMHDNEK